MNDEANKGKREEPAAEGLVLRIRRRRASLSVFLMFWGGFILVLFLIGGEFFSDRLYGVVEQQVTYPSDPYEVTATILLAIRVFAAVCLFTGGLVFYLQGGFEQTQTRSFLRSDSREHVSNRIVGRLGVNSADILDEKCTSDEKQLRLIMLNQSTIQIRLVDYLRSLQLRTNVNLASGVIFALVGIVGLYVVSKEVGDLTQLYIKFLPRATLAIIIEVVAFFFLRLYSKGLDEIKYIQNELTTLDTVHTAALVAMFETEKTMRASAIWQLLETDRNSFQSKEAAKNGISALDSERTSMIVQIKALLEKLFESAQRNTN